MTPLPLILQNMKKLFAFHDLKDRLSFGESLENILPRITITFLHPEVVHAMYIQLWMSAYSRLAIFIQKWHFQEGI